jgi:hypothetical protein
MEGSTIVVECSMYIVNEFEETIDNITYIITEWSNGEVILIEKE